MLDKLKHLKNHQGFIKYFKNTSWIFAEKFTRMTVGLFVGMWVARYLGPEQFGLFSYALSFVSLFTAVSTLGLQNIVVRELVKNEARRDELIGTAFWLQLIGTFFILTILVFAVNFTSNDSYTNTLVLIIASATFFQGFNVIDFYFQSRVMSRYVVYANTISLLISSIIKIVLILYEAPLISFAYVVLLDSIVLALGLIYFFLKKSTFSVRNLIFNKFTAVDLLRDSWPLMLGGLSFVVFSNIDNIMIKEMLGNQAVGYYSAGYKLVTLWYFLPFLLLSSLLPSIVNTRNDGEYLVRIKLIATLLIWVAIFIFIIYFLFAKYIVLLTYGAEYSESIELIQILSLVNILMFYNSLWNYWMMVENKTKRILAFHSFTAVFNTILNYYFISIYGTIGAVYALLFSLILSYMIFSFYDRRLLSLFLDALFLKAIGKLH